LCISLDWNKYCLNYTWKQTTVHVPVCLPSLAPFSYLCQVVFAVFQLFKTSCVIKKRRSVPFYWPIHGRQKTLFAGNTKTLCAWFSCRISWHLLLCRSSKGRCWCAAVSCRQLQTHLRARQRHLATDCSSNVSSRKGAPKGACSKRLAYTEKHSSIISNAWTDRFFERKKSPAVCGFIHLVHLKSNKESKISMWNWVYHRKLLLVYSWHKLF